MRILANSMPGWAIPLIIVAVFGIIVVGVILVKKYVHFFQSDEKPKSDKEIAKEELDRILEPVEELNPQEEKKEDGEDSTETKEETKK